MRAIFNGAQFDGMTYYLLIGPNHHCEQKRDFKIVVDNTNNIFDVLACLVKTVELICLCRYIYCKSNELQLPCSYFSRRPISENPMLQIVELCSTSNTLRGKIVHFLKASPIFYEMKGGSSLESEWQMCPHNSFPQNKLLLLGPLPVWTPSRQPSKVFSKEEKLKNVMLLSVFPLALKNTQQSGDFTTSTTLDIHYTMCKKEHLPHQTSTTSYIHYTVFKIRH